MACRVLQKGETRITQGYSNGHKAVDLGRCHVTGEPVVAHSDGTVVFCQTGQKNNKSATGNASYGNCVKIDHGDGYTTLYAHLAKVTVKKGDRVERGQVIGTMGNTGRSFGMHLHFEVRKVEQRVDPTPFLEGNLPVGEIAVRYRAYTNRWLPTVTDCHEQGSDGYAGIKGQAMSGLSAVPTVGALRYRVHLQSEKRWLPWVENDADFAGNLGVPIDAVQMQLKDVAGYEVRYRVSSQSGRWHGWCTGLADKTGDGYAGVFGKAVDRIQLQIVRV